MKVETCSFSRFLKVCRDGAEMEGYPLVRRFTSANFWIHASWWATFGVMSTV